MKSLSKVALALIVAAGVVGVPSLSAQDESPVSVSLDVGFVNQYLWRGFVLNDTPSLQPGLTASYKGLSVSSWSNFAHTGPNGESWTEHDLVLDYTHSFGDWSASVGYINYVFPDIEGGSGRYTNEVYFGFAHSNILNPSVTIYRDFDEGEGWYYYMSIGHSFPLYKGVTFNPALGLGVNDELFIEQTTVSNFDVGFSVDVPLGEHVAMSPFYTRMIGNDSIFGSHDMFGVTLSFTN